SQESFLGSFSRVPAGGLDPTQVYSAFLKLSARLQQLEAQVQRASAPALLEAALREATEVRTQAAQAAERAYNEIVQAAAQQAEQTRAEAEQTRAAAQSQAEALVAEAQQAAERLRQEGGEWNAQVEQE